MRRILISLSSLFAVAAAFLSSGSAAFAMRVDPLGGSSVNVAPAVHHPTGLALWQVGLIVVAGVVVLAAAALGARWITLSRRHAPASATS
jgi:hypothetical protein